ncbi:MAG: PHP domain-containing protein [Haloarculaceae archaeon]
MYDYHAHSTYSDGSFMWSMLRAAEDAGLDGLGFADHCNVSDRESLAFRKRALGFNLDLTYERRREAIEGMRDRFDMRVFDAVELDYDPRDEAAIRSFLDGAGFDYAVGSVHHLDGTNVHIEPYFAEKSEAERRDLVATYFDDLVALAESELFEIAAHVDLVERNPALRGYASEDQYRRAAEAFADSRTVPELNAGRVLGEYGRFHPAPRFLELLREHGVDVVVGADAHEPDELRDRHRRIESYLDEAGLETVELDV